MKKLAAVISTTLLLASASASATEEGQFYIGAKAGVSWLNNACTAGACDEDSWALGSFLGYQVSDVVALEAGLGALGETSGFLGMEDQNLSQYSFAPRFSYALSEDVNAFAKVGGAFMKYASEDDFAFLTAAGLSYSLMPSIDLQAEYQHFNGIRIYSREFNANTFTIGFRSNFGGSTEPTPEPVQEVLVEEVVEEVVVAPVVKTFEAKLVGSSSFAHNSAELTATGTQKLDALVAFMTQYPQANVEVVGYTDSRGAEAYNQKLSEKRAQSVANALEEQGIDASRITATGKGESNPVATNETAEGRAQNRRVEIVVPAFEYEEK
ncbi:OmpA family protein [Vibrio nereis]|uniref:OmpA-like domain-containing protein n=1 Tax=Vibrio nereis TaxID=693 RepID=A0A0M0HKB7_VIBNE|nr:OmpA family protein [Vibrio nereis]KOO02218.1 hypothetical protein AKJ17_16605 [Vibrio nereis]